MLNWAIRHQHFPSWARPIDDRHRARARSDQYGWGAVRPAAINLRLFPFPQRSEAAGSPLGSLLAFADAAAGARSNCCRCATEQM